MSKAGDRANALKVPEALLLPLAVRPLRLALVERVCWAQEVPMLTETGVPADQVRPLLLHRAVKVPIADNANGVEPTQKFRDFRALFPCPA